MDEKMQDRIDEYILGRMTTEERKVFEKDLETDKGLKEQYEHTKIVRDELSAQARLKETMEEWDKEDVPVREHIMRKTLWWVAGIAAVVVIGLFLYAPSDRNLPFRSEISDTENLNAISPAVRGGSDLIEIEQVISQGDHEKALMMINAKEEELRTISDSFTLSYTDNEGDEEMSEKREYEKQELEQRKESLQYLRTLINGEAR